MRSSWWLALVVGLSASACSKSGDRLAIKGRLLDVERPANTMASEVAADSESFFFVRDAALLRQDIFHRGDERILAKAPPLANVALTKSNVAFWSDAAKTSITIVPKTGGASRLISVATGEANAQRGRLLAVDEILLFMESRDEHGRVIALSLADPTPRVIADVVGGRPTIQTGPSSYSVTTYSAATGYHVAAATLGGPLREIYRAPSPPDDEASLDLAIGADHVFVLPPRHPLSSAPVPLLAIPRAGGAAKTIEATACPGMLAVLGDDPLYAVARGRCPGEFPEAQRLELRRANVATGQWEIVYAAFVGSIYPTTIDGANVLIDERVPLKRPEGAPPEYRSRTALLTLSRGR